MSKNAGKKSFSNSRSYFLCYLSQKEHCQPLVAGIHILVKISNSIKIGVALKQFTVIKELSQRAILATAC